MHISYIIYTYNNIVLCACVFFGVCYAYMFYCAKTFSFILIINDNDNEMKLWKLARILYNLLSFYLDNLLEWKFYRKIYNLLEIYTGIGIVTKYNLLINIMTLTFCNNYCQHLFIGVSYIVNLRQFICLSQIVWLVNS